MLRELMSGVEPDDRDQLRHVIETRWRRTRDEVTPSDRAITPRRGRPTHAAPDTPAPARRRNLPR